MRCTTRLRAGLRVAVPVLLAVALTVALEPTTGSTEQQSGSVQICDLSSQVPAIQTNRSNQRLEHGRQRANIDFAFILVLAAYRTLDVGTLTANTEHLWAQSPSDVSIPSGRSPPLVS